jgi:hypothetical protein
MRIGSPLGIALLGLLAVGAVARAQDDSPDAALARRIRAAVARASQAVTARVTSDSKVAASLPVDLAAARPLIALALERGGGPRERDVARALVDKWWEVSSRVVNNGGYQTALGVSALEGLSLARIDDGAPTLLTRYRSRPLSPDARKRIAIATRALISMDMLDDAGGLAWGYASSPFWMGSTVERRKPAPGVWDNSNTQFAVLALHDAARAGVEIPAEVARGIATHFVKTAQREPSGGLAWSYRTHDPSTSMTAAALSSLAVARELGAKGPEIDDAIQRGLEILRAEIPTYFENYFGEGPGRGTCYQVYSIEKALDLLEVEELGGVRWFPRIAGEVLANQGRDGLWQEEMIDTCLCILFLTRGSIARSRVVEVAATGGGQTLRSAREVYIARTGATVDAAALVHAYGEATITSELCTGRRLAEEAIRALEAEGHGREACLLGVLGELEEKVRASKSEAGEHWMAELAGRRIAPRDAELANDRFEEIVETRDAEVMRVALAETSPLPLRAFAAASLAALPSPDSTPAILDAAAALARDRLLGTTAGARTARAFACALAALGLGELGLPATGRVEPERLEAAVAAARERFVRLPDAAILRALEVYGARERDPLTWKAARERVAAFGRRGLARVVLFAEDERHREGAFELLRETTGETIPDDAGVWRRFVEGRVD